MNDDMAHDDELDELAALDALDLLDDEQRDTLKNRRGAASASVLDAIDAYREVALGMALSTPPVEPPASVRQKLMREISATRSVLIEAGEGWIEHAVAGVRYKTLNVDENRATVLAQMDPGASFPEHEHAGDEECYVVTGSLVGSDVTLHAGDFLKASKGSAHGPLHAPEGCLLMLGFARPDYLSFTGAAC